MKLKMFQVDAFASKLFSGNPAAVVILESFLDDRVMQSIAAENNLSETAFVEHQYKSNFNTVVYSIYGG
jgi:PhzF family phenazine biosynthesis protein